MDLIKQLPADKKKAVEDLVFTLASESGLNITQNSGIHDSSDKKEKMKFGDLKGFVTYIADDFDEPLDDFKEYM